VGKNQILINYSQPLRNDVPSKAGQTSSENAADDAAEAVNAAATKKYICATLQDPDVATKRQEARIQGIRLR